MRVIALVTPQLIRIVVVQLLLLQQQLQPHHRASMVHVLKKGIINVLEVVATIITICVMVTVGIVVHSVLMVVWVNFVLRLLLQPIHQYPRRCRAKEMIIMFVMEVEAIVEMSARPVVYMLG
jgi:hypothetical protein